MKFFGKIKVVGEDFMCFPVDPKTLMATSCSTYDPYAFSDPDSEAVETIGIGEYYRRLNKQTGVGV